MLTCINLGVKIAIDFQADDLLVKPSRMKSCSLASKASKCCIKPYFDNL